MEDQYNYNQVDPATIDPKFNVEPEYKAEPQPITPTPVKSKKKLIIVIVSVSLLILLVIIYFLLGSSNSPQESKSDNTVMPSENQSVRLNLTSPEDGEKTTSSSIIIAGTTDKTAKLTINGEPITNNNGTFSYALTLIAGANPITIIATDSQGNKTVKNITVTFTTEISPTVSTSPTAMTSDKITLTAIPTTDGISFTWAVQNLQINNGFRLVKSSDQTNPKYPGDDYQTITENDTRSYIWNIKDGKVYHFRICQYDGNGACLIYSKNITITAPITAPTATPTNLPTNTPMPTTTSTPTPSATPTVTPT